MKKALLLLAAAGFSIAARAQQQRLSLYEEFSGENCGPCAAYNPGLWTLLNAGANPGKIMLIKYQSPIPTAGPIYTAYTTVTNARLSYYGVNSAPTGIQNGNEVNGHIANYTQGNIDAGNTAAPFSITAVHSWSANGDSIYATINITAVSAYAPASADLKLRVALTESLEYCSAPGTNGETEFHHVVREMYPNAGGTALPAAWTVGQTQTITIGGLVPKRVDKSNEDALIVVWIQNDANKNIPQAAKSVHVGLSSDAALTGCPSATLSCTSGTASVTPTAVLKNTGTLPLTAALISYKLDNGAYQTYNWTGSLAAGASANITLPAISGVAIGSHVITDSITSINGVAEINGANNRIKYPFSVYDNTAVTFPVATGFENSGTLPGNWATLDVNGDGNNWKVDATSHGHAGTYALKFAAYDFAEGETDYLIMPSTTMPAGARSLDFWVAHAQYAASVNEKLEVVYSTDCGANWTSIWSKAGSQLSTAGVIQSAFNPTAAQYRMKSVDVSSVPANAMLAFRAISAFGNNIWLDDVNLRGGAPTGVANIIRENSLSLYPNPASADATLEFSLSGQSNVQVQVFDLMGHMVAEVANARLAQGAHSFTIRTAGLASGLYQIKVQTEQGSITERLSVVK